MILRLFRLLSYIGSRLPFLTQRQEVCCGTQPADRSMAVWWEHKCEFKHPQTLCWQSCQPPCCIWMSSFTDPFHYFIIRSPSCFTFSVVFHRQPLLWQQGILQKYKAFYPSHPFCSHKSVWSRRDGGEWCFYGLFYFFKLRLRTIKMSWRHLYDAHMLDMTSHQHCLTMQISLWGEYNPTDIILPANLKRHRNTLALKNKATWEESPPPTPPILCDIRCVIFK